MRDRQLLQEILGTVHNSGINLPGIDQWVLVGSPGKLRIQRQMDMRMGKERSDVRKLPIDRAATELNI